MSLPARHYQVRAVRCDYTADDETVYRALRRATNPLDRAWGRLGKARRIGIKFNQDWNPSRIVVRHGHRQQLVSDTVVRATIRLLRERTAAELFVADVGVEGGATREECTSILPVLNELDVPFVDGRAADAAWTEVPGGGLLFERYPVPAASLDADAFVSVQKAKNHKFMGVTLALKNLFGLASVPPQGRPRAYYHHLVRLPYVLADLGRIYEPALNILDAIVCQAGEEWGPGEHARECNALIAGDNTIATDACVAHLMGHAPAADWPAAPFHRDRNALLVAAEAGYGTVNLPKIDFQTEIDSPMGQFFAIRSDPHETIRSWLRTTSEQALFYEEHRDRLLSRHAGTYILLQMGEVRWSSPDGTIGISRRELAGDHPEEAMWLKYVDPDETEGERFGVYHDTLRRLRELDALREPDDGAQR